MQTDQDITARPEGANADVVPVNPLEVARAISIELRRAARRARTVQPVTSGGGGFRARRSDRLFKAFLVVSFVLLFLVPVFAASIYYGAVADDQYVTEVRFAVRSTENAGLDALTGMSGLFDTGQSRDSMIIAEYVRSRTLMDEIDKKFGIHKLFDRHDLDFIGRLDPKATNEDMLDYWKSQIHISVDKGTGLVSLEVRAFTPEDSLKLAKTIVESSETMVNRLFRRKEVDGLNRANEELELAKKRLETAVGALRDTRNSLGILDVDVSAKAYGEILTTLRTELSKVEQDIDGILKGAADSPQVNSLRARADSINKQIRAYEAAMASGGDGDAATLATRAAKLEQKETDVKIARSEYATAVTAFERARLTVENQRAYLLTHVAPHLAEDSLYPKRWFMWGVVFFVSFLAWAIVAGLGFLVRDNMAVG